MDVKDFVSATLSQIIEGVTTAQAQIKDTGAKINPLPIPGTHDNSAQVGFMTASDRKIITIVDFDIGLNVGSEGKTVQVNIMQNPTAAPTQQPGNTGESHRVRFKIPITLPEQ